MIKKRMLVELRTFCGGPGHIFVRAIFFEHYSKYKCQEVTCRLNAFLNRNYNIIYVPGDRVKPARFYPPITIDFCVFVTQMPYDEKNCVCQQISKP